MTVLVNFCKKETELPRLSFSTAETQWFIYQSGQQYKFKNNLGDSLTYNVTEVQNDFRPEYKDPFTIIQRQLEILNFIS